MDTPSPKTTPLFEKLVELSALSFQYGNTFRATTYPDGTTLESDTDHSFMLGMIACSLHSLCAPELDRGKLAEYALIHDFVEVYAGDTLTLGLHDKAEKDSREHESLLRIKSEYDALFPWIGEAIERYEEQAEPEARFIKVLDKIMPGITQIQNGGEVFHRLKVPAEEIVLQKNNQREWVREVTKEWPLLWELYEEMLEHIFALPYFNKN
ncbi:MAG: HD domain-containing protein [Patescibacteria group bacterium]